MKYIFGILRTTVFPYPKKNKPYAIISSAAKFSSVKSISIGNYQFDNRLNKYIIKIEQTLGFHCKYV